MSPRLITEYCCSERHWQCAQVFSPTTPDHRRRGRAGRRSLAWVPVERSVTQMPSRTFGDGQGRLFGVADGRAWRHDCAHAGLAKLVPVNGNCHARRRKLPRVAWHTAVGAATGTWRRQTRKRCRVAQYQKSYTAPCNRSTSAAGMASTVGELLGAYTPYDATGALLCAVTRPDIGASHKQ